MGILTGGGGGNQECDAGSINQILDILAHPLRREALGCLVDASSQTMTVDDLVDLIQEAKPEAANEQQELTMQLYHVQLPKLAEKGAIEFDPRSGLIRYHPDEALETWLHRVQEWESE